MPGFMEWLTGSEGSMKKYPTGTKQQGDFHSQLLNWLQQSMQQGGGYDMANQYDQSLLGGGPEAFNNFSAPYLQQFQEQIVPGISERFAKNGALSSSGFGQALGGASTGLQSQLAQLFSQLQGQAAGRQQGQFQNNSQQGLNYSPFAYEQTQPTAGFLPTLMAGIGTAAAGPIGGALGSGFASLFKQPGRGGLS